MGTSVSPWVAGAKRKAVEGGIGAAVDASKVDKMTFGWDYGTGEGKKAGAYTRPLFTST
jgi:hypothetical protein